MCSAETGRLKIKTHRKKSFTGCPLVAHSVMSLTSLLWELHLINDTQNSLSSEDRTLDLRATVELSSWLMSGLTSGLRRLCMVATLSAVHSI